MMKRMIHQYFSIGLLALLCIVVYAGFEYDVEFNTRKPLGLKLDAQLKVLGFSRDGTGQQLAAEASLRIRAGDRLVAVNEQGVEKLSVNDVAYLIAKADLPKVLTFHTDDDSRINEAEEIEKELHLLEAAKGSLQLYLNGVRSKEFPVVMAAFGNKPQCRFLPLAYASPRDACGQLDNAHALRGKIALVERGICAFSDKAANIEEAGAHAFLLLNDGPAFRMPKNQDNPVYNNIPAFMLGEGSVEQLSVLLKRNLPLLKGLLKLDAQDCNLKPEVEEEVAAEQNTTTEAFDAGHLRIQLGYTAPTIGPEGEGIQRGERDLGDQGFGFADKAEAEIPDSSAVAPNVYFPVDGEVEFLQAEFGQQWDIHPRRLVLAEPSDGCSLNKATMGTLEGAVLLVERGGCSFEEKADVAAAAGAWGVIVANTEPGCFRLKKARAASEPAPTLSELEALEKAQIQSQQRQASQQDSETASEEVEVEAESAAIMRTGPAIASISKGGGQALRKLLETQASNRKDGMKAWVWAVPRQEIATLWEEVHSMLEPSAWPKRARDRRKLYFRLSKIHHPDKEEGSQERFQTLNYAYRKANYHYDPKVEPFEDDFH